MTLFKKIGWLRHSGIFTRNEGTYKKAQAKYANPVLLIIDEGLLMKPTESEQHDILELLHRRRRKSYTIFCSQYDQSGWYDQLGGDESPLAEAILDRIKHDACQLQVYERGIWTGSVLKRVNSQITIMLMISCSGLLISSSPEQRFHRTVINMRKFTFRNKGVEFTHDALTFHIVYTPYFVLLSSAVYIHLLISSHNNSDIPQK